MIGSNPVAEKTSINSLFKKLPPLKRAARFTASALFSVGLVGTMAMPAYAIAPEPEGMPLGFIQGPQTLTTADSAGAAQFALAAPNGAVDSQILLREQQEAERAAQERIAREQGASVIRGRDVPAGVGASGILNAAMAQVGDHQDCTALVERSLRAIGISVGDIGTLTSQYTALGGRVVTDGAYAPGDVLVWQYRHVAVYMGNGRAVHGGWINDTTLIAGLYKELPDAVVRFN